MILTPCRYLTTLAAAEFLYDAVAQWKARDSLTIDSTSLAFFKDLYPSVKAGKHSFADSREIVNAVTAYADSFVEVVKRYTPADGSLTEQFDRNNGTALSAVHLTWSYAAIITMSQRRAGHYPPSWHSGSAAPPPTTCAGTSTPGKYAPASAAGAPAVNETCTVPVRFDVNATTYFGENIYVTGSDPALGDFDGSNAPLLSADWYSKARPLWLGTVELPAGETIQYQYLREANCARPHLYETVKRNLTVPACGSPGISTHDAWTGAPGNYCV